jgi:hypothetical protein
VAEGGVRRRLEVENTGGQARVDAAAPARGVGGAVADFDLAAREHEVAGGELARAVTPDQEDVVPAVEAIAEQHQRGGRDRSRRRRFDGHEPVCHDVAAAVMCFVVMRPKKEDTLL